MSRKMNAGDAASIVLKVFEITSGASLPVLVAIRDGFTARIDSIIEAKKSKEEVA